MAFQNTADRKNPSDPTGPVAAVRAVALHDNTAISSPPTGGCRWQVPARCSIQRAGALGSMRRNPVDIQANGAGGLSLNMADKN